MTDLLDDRAHIGAEMGRNGHSRVRSGAVDY